MWTNNNAIVLLNSFVLIRKLCNIFSSFNIKFATHRAHTSVVSSTHIHMQLFPIIFSISWITSLYHCRLSRQSSETRIHLKFLLTIYFFFNIDYIYIIFLKREWRDGFCRHCFTCYCTHEPQPLCTLLLIRNVHCPICF